MALRKGYGVLALSFSAALIGLSGCQQAPAVHTYAVQGTVLGMSALTHQVTIHQDAIHGFLPAENVAYTLKNPAILGALKVGQRLQAQAMDAADSSYPLLTHVTVTEQAPESLLASELPAHHLLVGERVPATPLVNEAGQPVDLQQYRGKALLLTFIDTRCTDDCPIITSLFARVNALLAKSPKAYADSKLISISIDPAFDKPPVLRRYGLEYLHTPQGFAHWEFVDSTPANLQRLAKSFGEVYFPTKDDIDHTMDTVLIGPNNTFVRTWDGTHWKPDAVVRAVEAAERQAPS